MKIKRIVRIEKRKDVEIGKYCCSSIKERLHDGSSFFLLKWDGIFIFSLYGLSTPALPYSKINFCPFCGEKIEIEKEIKEKEEKNNALARRNKTK